MSTSIAEPIASPSAEVISICPLCSGRLVVQRIIPGRSGLEYWRLRCTKCGQIHQDTVDTANAIGRSS
jgi:uncharacterized Zn finger protein